MKEFFNCNFEMKLGPVLWSFLLVFIVALEGFSQEEKTVYFLNGAFVLSDKTTQDSFKFIEGNDQINKYFVISTYKNLLVKERELLKELGIEIVKPITQKTYWAKVNNHFDEENIEKQDLISNFSILPAEYKIHPSLSDLNKIKGDFLISDERGKLYNYVLNDDNSINVCVNFIDEVDEKSQFQLISKFTEDFQNLGGGRIKLKTLHENLFHLANENLVEFIEPISEPFSPSTEEHREFLGIDELQTFDTSTGIASGLAGRNIRIGIFDSNLDSENLDYSSRLIINDPIGNVIENHGTFVAGIALGDGSLSNQSDNNGNSNGGSPFQWRGVATASELLAIKSDHDDELYKWFNYINLNGMNLSNHSYNFSRTTGRYNGRNALFDRIANGNARMSEIEILPRLQVASAGNFGSAPRSTWYEERLGYWPYQSGYFSLTIQSKNVLIVGNFDSFNERISQASSLGPTHDGRIKPDIVAPGTRVKSSSYRSADDGAIRRNFYSRGSGTSYAAPFVTGSLALFLEKWIEIKKVDLRKNHPLPSTLRGVVIHTATDISGSDWGENEDASILTFDGPDFVTGWGQLNPIGLIDAIDRFAFIEDQIDDTCDSKEFSFHLNSRDEHNFRVSLTWDDVPANVNIIDNTSRLINDLDLELIDPDGNIHYPWKLNQDILFDDQVVPDTIQTCGMDIVIRKHLNPVGSDWVRFYGPMDEKNVNDPINDDQLGPATRGKDHLNNVEVIDAPYLRGVWKARVSGFNLTFGPQKFSLIFPKQNLFVINNICRRFPQVCKSEFAGSWNLCDRYPMLCNESNISFEGNEATVKFRDFHDRVFVPVREICKNTLDCSGCEHDSLCNGFVLSLSGIEKNFNVDIKDETGNVVAKRKSSRFKTRFSVRTKKDLEYFIVLSPNNRTKIDGEYKVPMLIEGF